MSGKRGPTTLAFKLAAGTLAVMAGFLVAELGARIVWKNQYNRWLAGQLHGFDHVDAQRSLIIPDAGTHKTVDELRKSLSEHNKTIGLAHLENLAEELDLADSAVVFSINSLGFRGPEIEDPKPAGVLRVLAIGDSCTWGPSVDHYSYPQVLERELAPWVSEHCHRRLEVVNAGVLGYNFERVLKRIDEYLAVDPDIVTIYLGWNRTIGRADPRQNPTLYRSLALYRFFYHAIINRDSTGLQENFSESTTYEPNDPGLDDFRNYDFRHDMADLALLVDEIEKRDITVVLVTLAGVLDWRVEADKRALQIAYPIASTNNLYAYPLLTRRFNDRLREFAGQRALPVVDFETYALEAFTPRSSFFIDSVHPNIAGYQRLGAFLAAELQPLLGCD